MGWFGKVRDFVEEKTTYREEHETKEKRSFIEKAKGITTMTLSALALAGVINTADAATSSTGQMQATSKVGVQRVEDAASSVHTIKQELQKTYYHNNTLRTADGNETRLFVRYDHQGLNIDASSMTAFGSVHGHFRRDVPALFAQRKGVALVKLSSGKQLELPLLANGSLWLTPQTLSNYGLAGQTITQVQIAIADDANTIERDVLASYDMPITITSLKSPVDQIPTVVPEVQSTPTPMMTTSPVVPTPSVVPSNPAASNSTSTQVRHPRPVPRRPEEDKKSLPWGALALGVCTALGAAVAVKVTKILTKPDNEAELYGPVPKKPRKIKAPKALRKIQQRFEASKPLPKTDPFSYKKTRAMRPATPTTYLTTDQIPKPVVPPKIDVEHHHAKEPLFTQHRPLKTTPLKEPVFTPEPKQVLPEEKQEPRSPMELAAEYLERRPKAIDVIKYYDLKRDVLSSNIHRGEKTTLRMMFQELINIKDNVFLTGLLGDHLSERGYIKAKSHDMFRIKRVIMEAQPHMYNAFDLNEHEYWVAKELLVFAKAGATDTELKAMFSKLLLKGWPPVITSYEIERVMGYKKKRIFNANDAFVFGMPIGSELYWSNDALSDNSTGRVYVRK